MIGVTIGLISFTANLLCANDIDVDERMGKVGAVLCVVRVSCDGNAVIADDVHVEEAVKKRHLLEKLVLCLIRSIVWRLEVNNS